MAEDEDDLSDFEDEILQQLQTIRKLKKEREERQTNLVNSDDEEDPRRTNGSHQQPSYFSHKQKPTKNERILKEKIREKTSSGASFLSILHSHQKRVKTEVAKQKSFEEEISANRVYSFDLGAHFKPIDETVDEKDGYSGRHLSKRYVPKKLLKSCLNEMKVMRIENALADIAPPKYRPPVCANFVVIGIIASKSEVASSGMGEGGHGGKYEKIRLTNFKQQITLSLFDKAFKRYWKLRVGDVIGVLNPRIWPFQGQGDTGFTLFLKEDTASIIEIGKARDFGFCKSVKKDGTQCKNPVDLSKGDHCDYHMEMQFKRTAAQRMELGSSVKMFAPKTKSGRSEVMLMGSDGRKNNKFRGKIVEDLGVVTRNDTGMFSSPEASKAFFEKGYTNANFFSGIATERVVRQKTKKEKELRRKLAKIGGGTTLMNKQLENKKEKEHRSKVTRTAFSASTMGKIGFDPTRRIYEGSKNYEKKASGEKTRQILEDLKQKNASSQKLLTHSKEFLQKRRREKEDTIEKLREVKRGKTVALSDSDSDEEEEDDEAAKRAAKRFMALRQISHT